MVDKLEIIENVKKWVEEYMPNFQFRKYQYEYIVATIESILNNTQLNIIEAPTGSGKSIIVLIMAGVLDKYYDKTSYILCSDLYLWQQYATIIDSYKLYYGKLKGSWNNYICNITGEDYISAPCKLAYIGYTKLFDNNWCINAGWGCALTCDYIKERKKAIESNVTLMTYQLWFPYMNDKDMSFGKDGSQTFTPRDIIFCDECHNIPNLCQDYGDINIDFHNDITKIQSILEFCQEKKFILSDNTDMKDFDIVNYILELKDLFNCLMDIPYTEQNDLVKYMKDYQDKLKVVVLCYNALQQKYQKETAKSNNHKKLTKREYYILDCAKWADKLNNSICIYFNYLEDNKYVVKTDNKIIDSSTGFKIFPDNPTISIKYAKEDVWVYEFLLKHQPYTVLLSATIGDHRAFDDNIGTHLTSQNHSTLFRIPSTFDFSNSPIYFIPGNKMSKEYIEESMINNAKTINTILKSNKHINEKGIIHTGSYKNAYDLLNLLDKEVKDRIYIYSTSKEKQDILDNYAASKNGILIGPTLTEGVDFPEDGCRFIIILKIPYPYLGDNLVKAKLALFPRWYNSETSNNVIQGIGRGNRTPNDWSTTYILDGSFSKLYQETRLQYPDEMKNRIKVISNKQN